MWKEPECEANPEIDPRARFFFVHVMKTGGTSFWYHARANFHDDALYPHLGKDEDVYRAYLDVYYLTSIDPERLEEIRCFRGHFPYCATELLDLDLITLTVLRDPVDRVISMLKHIESEMEPESGRGLEAIYDDPVHHAALLDNVQVRQFALTVADAPRRFTDQVEIDDERLEIAKGHLSDVDVVGLHEHYDEFLAQLAEDHAWRVPPLGRYRRSGEGEVSRTLRRRITEDIRPGIEFYEYARDLYEERRRERRRRGRLGRWRSAVRPRGRER